MVPFSHTHRKHVIEVIIPHFFTYASVSNVSHLSTGLSKNEFQPFPDSLP